MINANLRFASGAPRPDQAGAGRRPAETPADAPAAATPPADGSAPRETSQSARPERPAEHAADATSERKPDDFAALLGGKDPADAASTAVPAAATAPTTTFTPDPAPATPDQLLAMLAGALALPVAMTPPELPASGPTPLAAGIPTTANPIALPLAAPVPVSAAGTALPAAGLVALDASSALETAAPAEGRPTFDTVLNGLASPSPTASTAVRETAPPPPPLQMPTEPANGFDDGIGTHVAWMAGQRLGEARITVSPEHLGPIEVTLQVDDARVDAQFHSTHVEVRAALEASVPRLREMLAQHGLQLGQADVGQRHADRPQTPSGRSGGDGEHAGTPVQASPIRHRRGLLDEYA